MKKVFASHWGALCPHSLLWAAGPGVADRLGCVSRQAGSTRAFWKKDVAVLLLTSVAGIVLCCASQGFCSIIGAHFITLFWGRQCVCVCARLLQSPLLLTYALHRDIYSGFLWCIPVCTNLRNCFNVLRINRSDCQRSYMHARLFFFLLHHHCEDAAAPFPHMCLWPKWTKQVFP